MDGPVIKPGVLTPRVPRRRASQFEIAGHERAKVIALRTGVALRDVRRSLGLKQAEVGRRAGISQVHVSRLEHGSEIGASLDTWARVAAAVGEQLVTFIEHVPGSDQPRDLQHVRRQSALVTIAAKGGWRALPEFAIDEGKSRSRSIDVALIRPETREAVVAEIWDWFDDVGSGLRSLDGKVAGLSSRLARAGGLTGAPWRVGALYIVRDTRRNRRLIAELGGLFAARFRGSSHGWLSALTNPDRAVPLEAGLLWSDQAGLALRPSRLRG
jgi:transcriptional regulator with XRE-family HTH domain